MRGRLRPSIRRAAFSAKEIRSSEASQRHAHSEKRASTHGSWRVHFSSCHWASCRIKGMIYVLPLTMGTSRSAASTRRRRRRPHPRVTDRAARKRGTHERILQSGATIARREGLRAAASVPRVMRGAGLTTGGFYARLFLEERDGRRDRPDAAQSINRSDGSRGKQGLDWLQRAVKRYLSVAHRDNVDGCGYPAVLSEIVSAPKKRSPARVCGSARNTRGGVSAACAVDSSHGPGAGRSPRWH